MVTYKDREYDLVVTIEDNVIESLKKSSIDAYPNETGGFLAERYLSNNCAYVECLVEPSKKKCSPCSFQRSTKGMNKLWDRLNKKGLIYLGEWHSHPNGSSIYSNTDLDTIRSIASNENIKIIRPLLLIVSLNNNEIKKISLYHYDSEQLKEMQE